MYADREKKMTQEFSLDKKRTTVLVTVFLLLCLLIFVAGYLSGIIVGLPEPEQQPVVKALVTKPQPGPPVVTMQVPPVIAEPEPEVVAEVAEPEPEAATETAEPEPEEVDTPEEKLYSVQVGSFMTPARAEIQLQELSGKGYDPYIYHGANSKGALWYTVRVADFADVDEAIEAAREFRTREGSAVALTHYNSLMLVKTPEGKRILIEPFGDTDPVEASVEDKPEGDDSEIFQGDKTAEEIDAGDDESITDREGAAASDESGADATLDDAGNEMAESATDDEVLAAIDDEAPAATCDDAPVETVSGGDAAKEGSTEGEEGEERSSLNSQISPPQTPEPDTGEVAAETGYRITFALPEPAAAESDEPAVREDEGVGGLIAVAEANSHSVQVGAFLKSENADRFAEKLRGRGYPAAYVFHYTDSSGNAWSAVRAGDFKDFDTAREAVVEFEEKESISAIVTRIDAISMVMGK